jgi:hypothetical protein
MALPQSFSVDELRSNNSISPSVQATIKKKLNVLVSVLCPRSQS